MEIKMSKKDFPVLSGLRFLAASCVFIFHYVQILLSETPASFAYYFLRQLNVGVSLFFVLSGFLITYRYYSSTFSGAQFRYYMLKRIARIFPVYYLVLLVQLLLIFIHKNAWPDLKSIMLSVTLLKGLSATYFYSILTQSWSLTVEEMFYLYAPFCFFLIRTKKIFLIQIPLLLGVGFLLVWLSNPYGSLLVAGPKFMLAGTFFGRCLEFFVGIYLALVLLNSSGQHKTARFTIGGGTLFLCLLVLLSFYAYKGKIEVINDFLPGILLFNFAIPLSIGLFYYGLLVEKSFLKQFFGGKLFILLGKSSYAFYLLHIGMVAEIFYFHVTKNILLLYFFLQLLSIAVYKLFEKPVYFFILRKFAVSKNKSLYSNGKNRD